jgi:hypothetical protein
LENSSKLTLGLGSVLFGTRYNSFLVGWWDSVKTLTRQPDSIVFVHDSDNKNFVEINVPDEYKGITTLIQLDGEYWEYRQAVQANQKADWFSICGIDDRYLPGAFDELELADEQGCDLYIDKLQYKHNGQILEGRWIPEEVPHRMTCPGQATAKKDLFQKTKGVTQGSIYDDWELYIRFVAAGAKPYHADTIRIIHDLGYDHVTLSGVNRERSNDSVGKDHIAKVRQELGL